MSSIMNEQFKSAIGFKYIMSQLSIKSLYGLNHYRQVVPYNKNEKDRLIDELNLVQSFIRLTLAHDKMIKKVESLLVKFKDIEATLNNCIEGKTLDLVELYEIKIQAIYMQELSELINSIVPVNELKMVSTQKVIELLSKDPNELTYDFYLYERYSKKLTMIREEKKVIEKQYYFVNNPKEQATLKEKRSDCVRLEDEEELRVRKALTEELSEFIYTMKENITIIGHLDFLIAKSHLALKFKSVKPVISDSLLYIKEMSNPLLEERVVSNGGQYMRNSISLNEGTTVITGANMSGKSSVLKAVALNALLAQLGFYVFATYAQIPLVDHILYVGSETETYKHGLSSFGLEITTLNQTISHMKSKRCIVCVDEFARSTNPSEGQKFVKAYATYANNFDSFTLFATHYDGVVDLDMGHYQIAGLKDELIKSTETPSIVTLDSIHNYMDYTLKKVNDQKEVPKEAYKVSLLLNVDDEFKGYLDKYYGE